MDVITLSDSDESDQNKNLDVANSSQDFLHSEQNSFYEIDWNDDDGRLPIDYSTEIPDNECINENVENYNTPAKNIAKNNEDELEIDDISFINKASKRTDNILDSDLLSQSSQNSQKTSKQKKAKLSQEEKEQKKLEREKLKEEKKAQLQKQKALKAAFFESKKNLKPEENIKLLKVHIDNEIINSAFGGSIITVLQENNIQYAVESQLKNFTVHWTKKQVEKIINDSGDITENVCINEENVMLYVLNWENAVELISESEFLNHIEVIKSIYCNKNLTVVIYGLGKYFNYQKNKKMKEIRAAINENKKTKLKSVEKVFEYAPIITKDQLEFAVTDLQLLGNHNCRMIETPDEFSSFILNITKSLSQMDLRREKEKRQNWDFGWVATDSTHSIKVDKNGNGLLRLWQQQLCQFNAVGLETAQAIVSQFKSPLALINSYEKIQNAKEGERLLEDIQVRREAGILSTSRRVGPQLSKKVFKFFTSNDPDMEL